MEQLSIPLAQVKNRLRDKLDECIDDHRKGVHVVAFLSVAPLT